MIKNKITVTVLLAITLLGLLLRLWGVGHGLGEGIFTHPDELPIATQSEDFAKGFFSLPEWSSSPLWTYLETIGVYLYPFFEGFPKFLFGMKQYIVEIPQVFGVLLIGRVMAATIGAMTVPVVYLSGKRLFGEKTGLVGAAIMAVVYVHVTQSHFAYIDVPQTFFLMLSFYFMVMVSITKRENKGQEAMGKRQETSEGNNPLHITRHSFLAGLFFGLAVATKISAIPGIVSLVSAHYLREKGIRRLLKSRYLYISFSGFLIGYGLLVPYYWIKPSLFVAVMKDLIFDRVFRPGLPPGPHGAFFDISGGFIQEARLLFEGIGIFFILLFFLGLMIAVLRREKMILFLLSFPVAYFPFTVIASWHDERELVPVVPFLVIVMAYGINKVAEAIPLRKKGVIILILSMSFIFPSLWYSLKNGYFLWQKDTRVLAVEWMRDNLPSKARVGIEGYTVYNPPVYNEKFSDSVNQRFSEIPLDDVRNELDFVVVSSSIYDNLDPEKKRYYDLLKERAQLVKEFKTFSSYFSNPKIEIYKLSQQGEALTSTVPRTYSEKGSFALSFGEGPYGKEPLSFWLNPDSKVNRVLITEKRLETIGVFIYNGSDRSVLRVRNTFNRKKIVLNPYEKKAIVFEPTRSFPFTKYIYNIAIKSRSGQGSFVNILTDPKRIANALLEIGEWEEAISILSKSGPLDKEGWSLLGLAYSMGGRSKDALDAFKKGLSPSVKELLDKEEWEKFFERSANIDPVFLRDSLTVSYGIDQLHNIVGSRMGWISHFDPGIDRTGFLLFGPYKNFPAGVFKAVFKIRILGSGERPAARIDVFNGEKVLAEKKIGNTRGIFKEIPLDFYNEDSDRQLEFRVGALGGREIWAKEIKVFPDSQGHYKRFLGMVHHYWGLSAGDLGLRGEAIHHFMIADNLGYKDTEALYRMAGVYEKMDMKEEAIGTYKRVIDAIPNHIDSLLALRGLTSQGTEVEEKIKALTPEHEIRQGFGDSIEFIGYSIGKESESPSPRSSPLGGEGGEGVFFKVHHGEEFNISYFWRSLKKLRGNYSIFVHFRREGTTVFQNDHSPSLQTNKWEKGGVVKEDYTVKVPQEAPSGKYDIVIGLWDPEGTKERVKLKGQKTDELKIGSIEVSAIQQL